MNEEQFKSTENGLLQNISKAATEQERARFHQELMALRKSHGVGPVEQSAPKVSAIEDGLVNAMAKSGDEAERKKHHDELLRVRAAAGK